VGSLIFRPMTSGDLEAIATNLCAGERMTMRDVYGDVAPADYIAHSILMSAVVHVGELDGRPVCVFGVVPVSIIDGVGYSWFMTTEELLRHPGTLVRGIQRHVVRLHEQFRRLVGRIDARHVSTIRWMRMLGGVVGDPQPGPNGVQFCEYVKES
jgi:hypothetical protein